MSFYRSYQKSNPYSVLYSYTATIDDATPVKSHAVSIDDPTFNYPLTIGNNIFSCSNMLANCTNYNQDVQLPTNVRSCVLMLANCSNFGKNIYIENNSANAFAGMLYNKNNLKRVNIYYNGNINATLFNSFNLMVSEYNTEPNGNMIGWTFNNANGCRYNTAYNIYLYANSAVSSISLDPIYLLQEGGSVQAVLNVNPSTTDYQALSWSSSNTSIATVNSSGLVTRHSIGECTISVTVKDLRYNRTFTTSAVCKAYNGVSTLNVGSQFSWMYENIVYNGTFKYQPTNAVIMNLYVDEMNSGYPRAVNVYNVVDYHNGTIAYKAKVVRPYYITRIVCEIDNRLSVMTDQFDTRPEQT